MQLEVIVDFIPYHHGRKAHHLFEGVHRLLPLVALGDELIDHLYETVFRLEWADAGQWRLVGVDVGGACVQLGTELARRLGIDVYLVEQLVARDLQGDQPVGGD